MFFGKNIEKKDDPETGREVKPRNQFLQTEPAGNSEKLKRPEKTKDAEKTPHEKFVDSQRVRPEEMNKTKLDNKRKPDSSDDDEQKGERIRERERE